MTTVAQRNRVSPSLAVRDVGAVLVAIGVGWLVSRYWLYPWLAVPENAPMLLRPVLGFLAAWYLLSRSGQTWAELGLRKPTGIVRTALSCVLLYAAVHGATLYLVPVLAAHFSATTGPVFLAYIRGNTTAFLGWVFIAWAVGGFIEELLFRGFLLQRVAVAVGGGLPGAALAVLFQAGLFGLLHLHQGSLGFVFAGLLAVIYGCAYHAFGRNLWPLVLVHGSWNTVAIARMYGS